MQEIVNKYRTDGFTNVQNHEYRMACELLKQKEKDVEMKEKDIQILKLRIELEKVSRKRSGDEMN